jgi:eukaryotic-like serine/threonine-protein kinase
LRQHNVPGMVGFVDASEIPAVVVMEWIDGPDLTDVVKARAAPDWETILRIGAELARIIYRAHSLPERVLHRDIRPPNVMLRNFWAGGGDFEVVVTDFDLSWHIDSLEKSVVAKPLGFLAPEQLHREEGRGDVSTRSAQVDSFGFGMTMYYLIGSETPAQDQQRHADWDQLLKRKVADKTFPGWRSLSRRMARLIRFATLDDQASRWDFRRVLGEMEVLEAISLGKLDQMGADHFAEEVACHAQSIALYQWDEDRSSATYDTGGQKIALIGNIAMRTISLVMEWKQTGAENWKQRFKSTQEVREKTHNLLERAGWTHVAYDGSVGFTRISATHAPGHTGGEPLGLARGIDAVSNALRPRG